MKDHERIAAVLAKIERLRTCCKRCGERLVGDTLRACPKRRNDMSGNVCEREGDVDAVLEAVREACQPTPVFGVVREVVVTQLLSTRLPNLAMIRDAINHLEGYEKPVVVLISEDIWPTVMSLIVGQSFNAAMGVPARMDQDTRGRIAVIGSNDMAATITGLVPFE